MNRKTSIIIISAAVAVLMLGGMAAYMLWGREAPSPEAGVLERLFPFAAERGGTPTGEPETPAIRPEEAAKPRLVRLTDVAVAGIKEAPNGRVRYIEKQTGHLYEISGNGEDRIRISNTTIPRIFSVHWSPDADKAILSYLNGDMSASYFSAQFTGTSTEGVFLPANAQPNSYAPSRDRFLYTQKIGNNYVTIAANPDLSDKNEVYSTTFADFLVSWASSGAIIFLARPSELTEGYLYELNLNTGVFNKIIGGINGLTAMFSPDGEYALIADSNLALQTISGEELNNLYINTFPEKCVFSATTTANIVYCGVPINIPAGEYPDDWYKGKMFFEDQIQKINTETKEVEIILEEQLFDIKEMRLDGKEEYLYFMDKKDETVWGLKL